MDPPKLSATLREAARVAREINLRGFETRPTSEVLVELVPRLTAALSSGVEVLSAVLDAYDPQGPNEVADLAFMARMELLSKQQQLEALAAKDDPLDAVSACGSARRNLLRGIFAVDRALCAREQLPLDVADLALAELQQSLRVRGSYARFRRDLLALGQPELIGVPQYLERAANRLGALIHGPEFDDFRLDDRLMIHRLLARLQAWLEGVDGRDLKSGLRLWQDLAGFVSLLVQVNHRSELVEHDRAIVEEAWLTLFGGPRPKTSVPMELGQKLEKLYGRDDDIDGIIESGMGQFAVEWHDPLMRVRASLGLAPIEE